MVVPVLAIVATIGVAAFLGTGCTAGLILKFKTKKRKAAESGHTRPRPPPAAPRTSEPKGEKQGVRQRRRDVNNRDNSTEPEEPACACTVCFEENQKMVEIQPCRHDTVCEKCVNKIICQDDRRCPLCRVQMQGYAGL